MVQRVFDRNEITDDLQLPVLVVEDDEGLNLLIRRNLGRAGFQVEGVGTGREALARLAAAPDVLLLLDLLLPDMNGSELLTTLAGQGAIVPFIIMTGHGDERIAVEMMKRGARDYIVKDDRFLDLLPRVIARACAEIGKERKLAAMDAALVQAAENWQNTFNAIPDCVSVLDLERRFVRVNQALADHFGDGRPEALIGKKCHEVVYNLANPCDICPHDQVRQTRQTATKDAYVPRSGLFFQVTCSPMFDKQGELIGEVHVARDISALKQAAEEIARGRERYRALYDNAPFAYFSISARDGSILQCNHQASRLLGYDLETLARLKVFDLYADTPAGRPKAEKIFSKFQVGSVVRDEECQMQKSDGALVWVSLSVEPVLDQTGAVIESRSAVIDISERKRLEAALAQAQKMESIGTLAGGIAHDFNNLLGVIIGYSNLLESSLIGNEGKSYLANILTAADKAAQLTRGLLTFSRKQGIEPLPVNINDIIRDLSKMLWRILGEDIAMSSNLSAEALVVMADRIQMEQVLLNLAANSRDAMPGGGALAIDTCAVELEVSDVARKQYAMRPGRYARISVSDSGAGMDAMTMERIFDPFFTTKEVGRGTGLGLAIVYGIIKQHEGYINCYSEPGQGTVFRIHLPLIRSTVAAEGAGGTFGPPPGGSETILLAEDDLMLRNMITQVLRRQGYQVIEAVDGQDAVDRFRKECDRIALVILDVIMPKKKGHEASQEISRIRPGIKTLFVSGYPAEKVSQMGMLTEGVQYLSKPLQPLRLLRKLRELIDQPVAGGQGK